MRKASIDVGSNSVLLTVMEQSPQGWKTIEERSSVTALGRGTKTSGLISPEAQTETLRALNIFFEVARTFEVDEVIAAGTMALRIATNAAEFLSAARDQKTPIFILPAELEAKLGFLAVVNDPLIEHQGLITVVDPGGHSTEFVTAVLRNGTWIQEVERSVAVGAIGLREQVMPSASPPFSERLAAVNLIDDAIGMVYRPGAAGKAVVLGATGTNLVSIREKFASWEPDKVHGSVLEYEEVGRSVGWLCDMDDAQRGALVGIEKGREFTIHIGTFILERFMNAFRVENCTVSVRGWRHAMIENPEELRTVSRN